MEAKISPEENLLLKLEISSDKTSELEITNNILKSKRQEKDTNFAF